MSSTLLAGRLRNRDSIPGGDVTDSLLHNAQTCYGTRASSCTVGIEGCYPGVKPRLEVYWCVRFQVLTMVVMNSTDLLGCNAV
jgi:hypothetical protein